MRIPRFEGHEKVKSGRAGEPFGLLSSPGTPHREAKATRFRWQLILVASFFLLLAWRGRNSAQEAQETNLGTQISVQLAGDGTPGPYRLKDHFIFHETDSVEKNGQVLIRGQDYFIDYNSGCITFSGSVQSNDTLRISYKKLNLNLRKSYFHRELLFCRNQMGESAISSAAEPTRTSGQDGRWAFLSRKGTSDLTVSGSKTFSFEVGTSQDFSLKQGLWLSAKGKAARDLEVSLQLSDQNMPATPEGTTRRLEELDKVQIQVSSPNFSGTLGDYYLRSSGSELSSYERKLEGVTAQASVADISFSTAFASSQGDYFTNRFYGEDGKQGPYQLVGKNGESTIMILPGTERVWVDGEEMERGSGNDYTIDYSRGTIEFTPRRLITSDSRITVDLEYSQENYKRDLYAGDLTGAFLGGKVELKASGIFEGDNRNHPTALSLSSEDIQILGTAGNSRMSASREGATFVGEGQGEYDLAYDTSGNPYYHFVGSDSGSYRVSFSWVGEGNGSYRYRGGGVYEYVYPNNGSFSSLVLLPLPQSHSLFDLSLSFFPLDALTTHIEWARSKRDQNTFSDQGDEHNWGDAISVKSAYQKSDFQLVKSHFHRLQLDGEFRFIQDDFVPFGRVNSVENERIWGLVDESEAADERTFRLSGLVCPWKSLAIDFDYGRLKRGEAFTASRTGVGAKTNPVGWLSLQGKTERIKSISTIEDERKNRNLWTRNSLVLGSRHRRLTTTLSWKRERRISSISQSTAGRDNFDQLGGEVSLGLSTAIKAGTNLTYRQDLGDDRKGSRGYIWSNLLSVRDLMDTFSSDVEFTRRVKKYTGADGQNSRQDLLATRMDFYPTSQLVNVKFYHSQNQIHSARRVDNYLEVEAGKGDWAYEDGRYVPHPEGNFVRLSEWTEDVRPSLDMNKSIRLIFSPHKVSPGSRGSVLWSRIGRVLSLDSFINLHGRFAEGQSLGLYLLYPLRRLSDENILHQNLMVRHDLHLLPARESLGFRLRQEKTREDDRLLSETGKREEALKEELLVRSRVSDRHYLEFQMGREKVDEKWDGDLQNLVEGKSVMLVFTRKQAKTLELKVSTERKVREEQTKGLKARFVSLAPEFIWSLLSQGRLRAKLQWTNLRSTGENPSLPYVVTEGKAPGQNYDWRLFLDLKLGRHLVSGVAYSGESVPSKSTKHTAKVEVKALF